MNNKFNSSIDFNVPARDLKEIAQRLVSVDSFFGVSGDEKRISEIFNDQIFFRGRLIPADSWENPGNLEEGLKGGWLFFYHSLAWIVPLRRKVKTDSKYSHKYLEIVLGWLHKYGMPPTPLPTQKDPGDYTWYDMSTAWRTMIIIGAVSMVGADKDLLAHLETHTRVLANNDYYAKVGNHALHQNFALISSSLILNRLDYFELALQRIDSLRAISIDSDGVSLEGAVGYHLFNIDWWLSMSSQLDVINDLIEQSVSIHVPDMRPFLHYSVAPDGKIVPLGDSVMSRGIYRNVIHEYPVDFVKYIESDPHLLYVLSKGAEGEPLKNTMRVFKDGFWFSRGGRFGINPDQQSHVSLKFGPGLSDRVHVHDDAGSITFYPNGSRLIEDSCLYGYYGGEKREFVKSNRAHNGIVVQDRKYYRSAISSLDFSSSSDDVDQAEVSVLSIEKTRWTRIVAHAFKSGLLYVQDHVVSNGAPFQQIFNLGDDFKVVRVSPGRADVQSSDGSRAVFFWLAEDTHIGVVRGAELPLMGWRSTFEGEIHPIDTVTAYFSSASDGEVQKIGVAILALDSGQSFSDISLEKVELRKKHTKFLINKSSEVIEMVVGFGGEDFRTKVLVD